MIKSIPEMNSSNSSSVDEWDSWLDSWAGFWIEGVALPVIAAFGIVGEDKHDMLGGC